MIIENTVTVVFFTEANIHANLVIESTASAPCGKSIARSLNSQLRKVRAAGARDFRSLIGSMFRLSIEPIARCYGAIVKHESHVLHISLLMHLTYGLIKDD